MRNGKYIPKKRRLRWKREFVLVMSVVVLILGAVGGSLAYLFTETKPVENTFTPGEVEASIEEEFDGTVKENVTVKNEGTIDSYIRAMVVINWQKDGKIVPEIPAEGTDYSISFDLKNGWSKGDDGFYYWNGSVTSGGATGVLISNAEQLTKIGEYNLVIDILAQSIQADPAKAVAEAWGNAAAGLVGAK